MVRLDMEYGGAVLEVEMGCTVSEMMLPGCCVFERRADTFLGETSLLLPERVYLIYGEG